MHNIQGDNSDLASKPDMKIVKRCPRCAAPALKFDQEHNKLKCTACGFEKHIKI